MIIYFVLYYSSDFFKNSIGEVFSIIAFDVSCHLIEGKIKLIKFMIYGDCFGLLLLRDCSIIIHEIALDCEI